MSEFQRYAIYYLPEDKALASFGAAWLGWDVAQGAPVRHMDIDGIDLATVTVTPRKYGFHGTLKAPFRLAPGQTPEDLATACATLAASHPPVTIAGLQIAPLGDFLALIPTDDSPDLATLAARCVTDLDRFRAPLTDADLARRRTSPLTPRQDDNLVRWGYPYIFDDFRFHLTLSSRLTPDTLQAVQASAKTHLSSLPTPFTLRSISLVVERADGSFRALNRYPLTG
ncbi:MAG: DUF1045 domain-containing protein [Pseudomonadota bacterium]